MPIEQYLLLPIISLMTIEETTTETTINQEEAVDISSNLLGDIKAVEDTTLVEAVTAMIVGVAGVLTTLVDGVITMVIGVTVILEEAIRATGRVGITRKMIDGIMEAEAGTIIVNVC